LERAAAGIEGELAPARLLHTRALARSDPIELEHASATFESLGSTLLAAEAAADSAVAWRQRNNLRRSAAAELRASILSGACEDPVTPALQAMRKRAGLTTAERNVATAAAGGRSNKEIAHQLNLSIRSVENHLQRTYKKLGITSRTELEARWSSSIRNRPPVGT